MVRCLYFSCYTSCIWINRNSRNKKEETNGNVIIEPDKKTMKCLMEIKQGANKFDIDNLIVPLLGFRKIVPEQGKYKSQKFIDITSFITIDTVM